MDIAGELRCLVCQNETIAASHADLAVDLREQIRHRLAQGQSREQVVGFMVRRYGDFVLYRPPFKPVTWLLWLGPFVLLIAALRSEEHTSELQSLMRISYAVFCLKKKKKQW